MFHVSFYVLVEMKDAKNANEAEQRLADILPTTDDLGKLGKVKSRQWSVTETEDYATSNRPTEQSIS